MRHAARLYAPHARSSTLKMHPNLELWPIPWKLISLAGRAVAGMHSLHWRGHQFIRSGVRYQVDIHLKIEWLMFRTLNKCLNGFRALLQRKNRRLELLRLHIAVRVYRFLFLQLYDSLLLIRGASIFKNETNLDHKSDIVRLFHCDTGQLHPDPIAMQPMLAVTAAVARFLECQYLPSACVLIKHSALSTWSSTRFCLHLPCPSFAYLHHY